jgi:hypothetical protein
MNDKGLFSGELRVTVDKNMRDYSNEPAFIKAMERAIKSLQETPLPEVVLKRLEKEKS